MLFHKYSILQIIWKKTSKNVVFKGTPSLHLHRQYHLFRQPVHIQTSLVEREEDRSAVVQIGGEPPQRIACQPMSNQSNHWSWCYKPVEDCPGPRSLFSYSFDHEDIYRSSVASLFLSSSPSAFDLRLSWARGDCSTGVCLHHLSAGLLQLYPSYPAGVNSGTAAMSPHYRSPSGIEPWERQHCLVFSNNKLC